MTHVGRFKRMQEYETWATGLALGSVESVPADRRSMPQFQRALQVAAHIQVARRVWLERLHGRAAGPGIDFFPSWTIQRCRAEAGELDAAWSAYLDRLEDFDLDSEMTYTSSEGARYAGRVEDVLTHVFNHATYHRGQIARLATECGGLRASTDFVALTRRTL